MELDTWSVGGILGKSWHLGLVMRTGMRRLLRPGMRKSGDLVGYRRAR